ncbi:hypothetical protein BS50DRAFT_637085 [Corynespora cassiicola Philippines]|uniref:Uncharacterized protein n=1 Tax=Corynespora cassiicola Philippines TaxID=1448308 RepID=A0A2T2NEB9_CORCC|nr:hypothetical protein BS50DRAFT_637085 [Corynespora cassiicola Philippines]
MSFTREHIAALLEGMLPKKYTTDRSGNANNSSSEEHMEIDSPPDSSSLESKSAYNGIDMRVAYRQGWPLLPVLPVITSHTDVPKIFKPFGPHLHNFREILQEHTVTVYKLEVFWRMNVAKEKTKDKLTLCVQSDHTNAYAWTSAIDALRTYIQENDLTLAVEIIDRQAFRGLYTLPVLRTEKRTHTAYKRAKREIVNLLEGCGEEWSSLDLYKRGLKPKQGDCKPTIIITAPVPGLPVWWEVVVPEIRKVVGEKFDVEMRFGGVVKF